MKNKTCGECLYYDDPFCDYHEMQVARKRKSCDLFEPKEKPPTIGDKIRQMSDDELAEKFVYSEWFEAFEKQLLIWHSTVLPFSQDFLSRLEAIAATVAELKKEWKG